MDVNILITCYNTEKHVPILLDILKQFKQIKPTFCVVYSGDQPDFPCHVRIKDTKKNSRELAMIVEGMHWFKQNKTVVSRFLKLSAYVWPLNEDKILKIFEDMDKIRRPYAGNIWHYNVSGSLSADFFLLNTDYGDVFSNVTQVINDTEVTIFQLLQEKNKNPYLIPERQPVFWNNYWECKKLGLVMRPDLEENLEAMKKAT
jgi:hypothetical protein